MEVNLVKWCSPLDISWNKMWDDKLKSLDDHRVGHDLTEHFLTWVTDECRSLKQPPMWNSWHKFIHETREIRSTPLHDVNEKWVFQFQFASHRVNGSELSEMVFTTQHFVKRDVKWEVQTFPWRQYRGVCHRSFPQMTVSPIWEFETTTDVRIVS